jgi:hypothetical protein
MMSASKKSRFGDLPPEYGFVFNPYPDERISRCPFCEKKTGQRKVPLLIHIDPLHLVALNYTCRYCSDCDLLIAHKQEVEHLLTALFMEHEPSAIGNDYLVLGTVEKKAWREGMTQQKSVEEMRSHTHDFRTYYQELRMKRPGWYKPDQEPPVREPPSSQEWIKPARRHTRKKRR